MLNVSSAFKQLLYEGKRNYLSYADITLSDGTKLSLDNSDIWDSGMEISDSVSSDNSFDVGAAIVNSSKIVINNIYDDYSDYDFSSAEVIMYVGLKLPDGTIERVRKGTFHVDEPKYNGAIITLNCLDNMSKFDRPYSESTLQYPATLNQIVRDACSKCGVTLQTYDFPHDDYVVQERPEDEATTFGEVIQWAAQIACCFCRCDVYGRLELKWYDQAALERRTALDGGSFSGLPDTSNIVSGGIFNPWTTGESIDGGSFSDLSVHHIYSISSLSVSTDDVVITGIRVSAKSSNDDNEQEIVVSQTGTEGYVISFENNELINAGDGTTVAGWIGERLIGFRFRKASISHLSDPTIEAGDVAFLTDSKGRTYDIVISSTKFNSNGAYQNTESSALDPIRNSATRYSEATKNYVNYRKEIQKEKTDREQAIEELTNRINNSSGTFTTIETQPDGSNIYYLHNKPQLADSDIIWKMTAEAWGVSTDGGKTYNAGMTVDGDTIVRILSAVGINADWINAGDMSADRIKGGTLILGGQSNGNSILRIRNPSGMQIGYIDNTGVHFNQGTFAGSLSAATGTFAGNLSAAGGTFKGSLQAASGTFAGVLQAATGSFSGTITSNNAIITGGYISIITSTENYSIISLKSGSSFENAITPADIRIHYQDSFSKISGTGLATCDGNASVYISPNAVYVSEDPSGIVPYNYARTAVFKDAIRIYDSSNTIKSFMTEDHITSGGDIYAWGNIGCSGEKSRIVDTENYSNRKLYSYEFSSPMFGDIGEGITDQNGECYISFDDVFLESVNSNCEYQVFLQKEGQGDLWVEEKASRYFLVKGTENLKFAWEVKVKQRNYEYERLEVYGSEPELEKINYETEGLKAVDLLTQEYIENSTFDVTKYYEELEGMLV